MKMLQKQPPDVLFKKVFFIKMFFKISQNSQEISFNRDSDSGVSSTLCEIFKSTYFAEHLRTTTSDGNYSEQC